MRSHISFMLDCVVIMQKDTLGSADPDQHSFLLHEENSNADQTSAKKTYIIALEIVLADI